MHMCVFTIRFLLDTSALISASHSGIGINEVFIFRHQNIQTFILLSAFYCFAIALG